MGTTPAPASAAHHAPWLLTCEGAAQAAQARCHVCLHIPAVQRHAAAAEEHVHLSVHLIRVPVAPYHKGPEVSWFRQVPASAGLFVLQAVAGVNSLAKCMLHSPHPTLLTRANPLEQVVRLWPHVVTAAPTQVLGAPNGPVQLGVEP